MNRFAFMQIALAALLVSTVAFAADDKPTIINWSGKTIGGAAVSVPVDKQASVVVFAMADQDRSKQAIQQAQRVIGGQQTVQAVLVVSGEEAAFKAQRLRTASGWADTIVADPEYATSGTMHVRVWPTIVIVDAKGQLAGHIAGLPASLPKDLDAYVKFADGTIDKDQLTAALRGHELAVDSPEQAAHRHLQVARRLMELQQFDQAREQLAAGLKLKSDDGLLLLELARLDVLTGKPAEALKQLAALPADAGPAWRINALRGRAYAMTDQWDKAKPALIEGLKLNPEPAETYYFLGRAYEKAGNWEQAAKAYRQSFEHAPIGRRTVNQ